MATESFLKNVTIRDIKAKRSFVSALENGHKKRSKPVKISRSVQKISADKIRDFFGEL